MNLNNVYDCIASIAAEKGTNAKKAMAKEYLEDPLFKKIVKYAYDADKAYNVGDMPAPSEGCDPCRYTHDELFSMLDRLADKNGASDKEKQDLADLCSCSEEIFQVVQMIVKKDLRFGLQAKSLNAAYGSNFIFQVPYQRCSTFDNVDKVSFEPYALVQKKCDGQFAYGFPGHGKTKPFLTRNGNSYTMGVQNGSVSAPDSVIHELQYGWMRKISEKFGQIVTIGEMLIRDENGKVLPREVSNGLVDEFILGGGNPVNAGRALYVVWGWLTMNEFVKQSQPFFYGNVWSELETAYEPGNHVELVPCEKVTNIEQAREFYFKMRRAGEEGAILKDLKSQWAFNTAPDLVKMKNRVEAEFRIVDAYFGEKGKKYEKVLGGLTVESEDGKIVTNVGSGFSDAQRKLGVEHWQTNKGKIVTIAFEGVITDKTGRETWCLNTPSFKAERKFEKTEADTYEYCVELCKPPVLV